MPNFFYTDANGRKHGPVNSQQLKALAEQGVITPETVIENENGKSAPAIKVKGLTFVAVSPPITQPVQMPVPPVVPSPRVEPNPFTAAPPKAVVPSEPLETDTVQKEVTSPFGKVLASGNGKGNSSITEAWVSGLLYAAIIGVLLLIILPNLIHERPLFWIKPWTPGINFDKLVLYAWAFSAGITARASAGCVAKTKISVCENGITGESCKKLFDYYFDLHSFQLTYDSVTSVDVTKSAIMIHASGTQYLCYVKNPAEIQSIIIDQQRKVGRNETTDKATK